MGDLEHVTEEHSIALKGSVEMDEVEFPEAVILLGSSEWRCATCNLCCPRDFSIDAHIKKCHTKQNTVPALSSNGRKTRKTKENNLSMKNLGTSKNHTSLELTFHKKRSQVINGQNKNRTLLNTSSENESARMHISPHPPKKNERKELTPNISQRSDIPVNKKIKVSDGESSDVNPIVNWPTVSVNDAREKSEAHLHSDGQDHDDIEVHAEGPENVEQSDETPQLAEIETTMIVDECCESTAAESIDNEDPDQENETAFVSTAQGSEYQSSLSRMGEVPLLVLKPLVLKESENMGESPAPSPLPVIEDSTKDLMKEKYVVIVEKAGSRDYDPDSAIDAVLTLPIETPSLQADTLFPPATPIMPDMQSPHDSSLLSEMSSLHGSNYSHSTNSGILSNVLHGIGSLDQLQEANASSGTTNPVMFAVAEGGDIASCICQTCGAAFESLEELRCHRDEMIKFDVVSCNKCGDNFHGLHQLNVHVFHAHEKMAPKFCFLCDADCLDGFELEEHLLEHTTNETDRENADLDTVQHACKTCDIPLVGSWSDLMHHYHTSHHQFFCSKCFAIFDDFPQFDSHRLLHGAYESSTPVVYTCPVSDCFQMSANKEALMDHISWHEDRDVEEEELSNIPCHYCSAPFRNNVSLQRHLAEVHSEQGLKPFVCELCLEDFRHSLELHRHNTLRHPGIRRYGCAYCDQRFTFRSSHRRHVASQHDVPATVLHM